MNIMRIMLDRFSSICVMTGIYFFNAMRELLGYVFM